ncbi:serine hydrolase [Mucilaginibacter mali]|uniref:Serine hydrolase n=1 Tax=Mucilaginibacter mali TaxID=2740462 RepID=A0A7D4UC14_9SPHI|nr:serine hydrolase [Mucilaginibacter mali]QKJ31378.1 serine hydrolase [Mucilaginibacter mali]
MSRHKPLFYIRLLIGAVLLYASIGNASAQTEKNLDSLFGTLAKKGYLNGCVLIADQGKPIYQKAFGYANFDTKQPLTNETMFELASVSKQFTAMAIMQLHQQGKLSYNDSLNKYFPELPYHGITINNLLHHTSGIPDFLGWDDKMIDVNRVNYNNDVVASLAKNKQKVLFKPNDQLMYSNTNYLLLAQIVERVSGIPFGDYLDKNIFKPLGMTHTKVYGQRSAKQKIADYAYGYMYDPAKGRFMLNDSFNANRYEYYLDGVAGPYGISSNTGDMLKWDQALYTEKLVSKAEQELAYIPAKLNDGKEAKLGGMIYGFGWLVLSEQNGTRRYMHSGGYPGYMTMICRYPDKNKTIILLTNIYNVINLYELTFAIENVLFKKPFTIPSAMPFTKSAVLSPAQIKAIEGNYAFKDAPQVKVIVSSENGQIYVQLTGQPKVEVYAESELEVFYTVVAAKIRFTKDEKGVVTKLTLFQGGREIVAVRE